MNWAQPWGNFQSMFSPSSVLQSRKMSQLWKMSIQSPALARDLDTASSTVQKCICPMKTSSLSPYMSEAENWQERNTELGRNCSTTRLFRLCRPELWGILYCTCCLNPPASPDTLLSQEGFHLWRISLAALLQIHHWVVPVCSLFWCGFWWCLKLDKDWS